MKKKVFIAVTLLTMTLATPLRVFASAADTIPAEIVGNTKGFVAKVTDKANKRCKVYTDEALSQTNGNEYVDVMTDEIYIIGISNTYDSAYISYPTKNGRKERWLSTRALGLGDAYKVVTAETKYTTYYLPRREYAYGYISAGDTVFVYGTVGEFTRVIYNLDGGAGYKVAWVLTSEFEGCDKSGESVGTGNLADVAMGEVGYKGNGDKTKYNNYDGQPWCASFVCWCADKVGVSASVIPRSASCINMLSNSSNYRSWDGNAIYNMKKGDVVFFSDRKNGSNNSHHVGIVVSVDAGAGKITLVEGNTSNDVVKKNTYTVSESSGKITKGWKNHYFCGYISV